jgi:HK97 gp10 family phage protein
MKFNLELKGHKEAIAALRQLPKDVNDRIMYNIHRSAAGPVKRIIESATPSGNNDKKSKSKAESNVVIAKEQGSKVGVNVGYKKRAFYISFVDQGTRQRKVRGRRGKYKNANRGRISPRHFVSRAHDSAVPRANQYLKENYLKTINRSLRRMLKTVR